MLLTCSVHSVNVPIVPILGCPVTKAGYCHCSSCFILVIQCFFYGGCFLVVINTWYKDLHVPHHVVILMHLAQTLFSENSSLFLPRPLTSWPIQLLMILYMLLSLTTFPWNPPIGKIFPCCSLPKPFPHAADVHFSWTYGTSIGIPNQMIPLAKFCFSFFPGLLICDTLYSHRCEPRKGQCRTLGDLGV